LKQICRKQELLYSGMVSVGTLKVLTHLIKFHKMYHDMSRYVHRILLHESSTKVTKPAKVGQSFETFQRSPALKETYKHMRLVLYSPLILVSSGVLSITLAGWPRLRGTHTRLEAASPGF